MASDEAKQWVVNLASRPPKAVGWSCAVGKGEDSERWTLLQLHRYVGKHRPKHLLAIGRRTIRDWLSAPELRDKVLLRQYALPKPKPMKPALRLSAEVKGNIARRFSDGFQSRGDDERPSVPVTLPRVRWLERPELPITPREVRFPDEEPDDYRSCAHEVLRDLGYAIPRSEYRRNGAEAHG
jgi:hypothetical protein